MGSKLKTFFHNLGTELSALLHKTLGITHDTASWEPITLDLIRLVDTLKNAANSGAVVSLAHLIPNGIGDIALPVVQHILADALPTLEIFLGGEKATAGLEGQALTNAALQYCFDSIDKLPTDFRGKHWEDIARKFLEMALKVSTTEAKAMLSIKLGEMKAAESTSAT